MLSNGRVRECLNQSKFGRGGIIGRGKRGVTSCLRACLIVREGRRARAWCCREHEERLKEEGRWRGSAPTNTLAVKEEKKDGMKRAFPEQRGP
eukprot:2547558-Rhodomonas_salina.1